MKRASLIIVLACLIFSVSVHAQLPGQGNYDWATKWVKTQPAVFDESDPNAWMYGDRMYTGLAYDEIRDQLYVVHPASGASQILVLDPETGAVSGSVNTLSPVIVGGAENGRFALYKVSVDDEGRIYACNVVSPSGLVDGPLRVYMWNSPSSVPELVYEYAAPATTELIGTAFAVTGKRHNIGGNWYDSTRVFISTSSFDSYGTSDDELHILSADTRPSAPHPFRLAQVIKNTDTTVRYFGAGIAPMSASPGCRMYACAPGGDVRLLTQPLDTSPAPHVTPPSAIDTLREIRPILGGALEYIDLPGYFFHLFIGRMEPSSLDTAVQNMNNAVDVFCIHETIWNQSGLYHHLDPVMPTPALGYNIPNSIAGNWNRITSVGYKVSISYNPTDSIFGIPFHQIYYLSSNNGIGCYKSRSAIFSPVELSSFTAHSDGNAVQLAWTTASETNNYGFDIERSFGGGQSPAWEQIGFVEGRGTTTAAQEYSWSDPLTPAHEQSGTIKYRLKQTDYDGTYEYSPIVEVSIGSTVTGIALYQNYPNPFSGSTSISFTVPTEQPVTLTVYNTLGQPVQVVRQEAKQGRNELRISDLKPGMYMVVLQTREGAVTRRMVGR